MSRLLTQARFVRHQDAAEYGTASLSVNPRTRFAHGRAGLSWHGVRPYHTAEGVLRVLRRRSQVESPGHLRTLRRLPLPEGHPSGDRDVSPANSDELVKGWSGDEIDIETLGGFARPVGNLTIVSPATFAKMMTAEQWAAYAREYPEDAAGVSRPTGDARTGTSLGYNALWLGPTVEAEIVEEREGGFVGSWLGPDGVQYPYDVEHIIDPDCEIVQRLVHDNGFDPATLGGQHFAIALRALAGRGAEQSELCRVVDSRLIGSDPRRARVQFQVPRGTRANDMKWVVSASRDLPFEEGNRAWDGDEAAASIFGDSWNDNPEPAKAKVGFLIYDADAPDLKGSYKLPFARRGEDGRLRVPKSGLVAAAQFLPKTDAPQEILDQAQGVIDQYNNKFEQAQPSRDARGDNAMSKETIVIGVRDRGVKEYLSTKGIAIPTELRLSLDEVDAAKLAPVIESIMAKLAEVVEMLKMSESKGDMAETEMIGMREQLKDMPTVEEAKAALEKAQADLEASKTAAAEAAKTSDAAKVETDAAIAKLTADNAKLSEELAPVRAAQLEGLRTQLVKNGLDAKKAADCTDAAALKKAFVVLKAGATFDAADAATIDSVFVGLSVSLKTADAAAEAAKAAAAKNNPYTPGAGLRAVPDPAVRDGAPKPPDKTQDTSPSAAKTIASAIL